jgi:hypothetical protein
MKNVTIVLAEDVARWARVWAAHHDTSVSQMLGHLLKERMEDDQGYDAAMQAFLSRRPRRMKTRGRYPQREALHDRAVLR